MSDLIKYVESRTLTEVEKAWAKLALAILKDYISSGCDPEMDADWFNTLCCLCNLNPDDLQEKIDYIFGTEDDYGSV